MKKIDEELKKIRAEVDKTAKQVIDTLGPAMALNKAIKFGEISGRRTGFIIGIVTTLGVEIIIRFIIRLAN